ncbi:MAG: hypothetical protein AVDCRST_MAG77-1628 [uncultured Chloroflexi bacterium]|uniref:Uncharacterized protein n=1 Tax=uncultured Chloroflexota bacterium TaxID=166587 RepID=A0A6J4I2Z7_9CHLR|nr:MAG: hypothetical protein AVDCRST_MAG77-1628 [uncultured Chloroflexota bacterium]
MDAPHRKPEGGWTVDRLQGRAMQPACREIARSRTRNVPVSASQDRSLIAARKAPVPRSPCAFHGSPCMLTQAHVATRRQVSSRHHHLLPKVSRQPTVSSLCSIFSREESPLFHSTWANARSRNASCNCTPAEARAITPVLDLAARPRPILTSAAQ